MKQLYTGLILLLTAVNAGGQSLMDSLVAHYPLDGNAQDISGNNNHLTNSGATPTEGRDGTPNTAFRFNGSTSFMANTTERTLRPPAYTWAFWMKIDQLPANGEYSVPVNAGGENKDHAIQIANNYQGFTGLNFLGYHKHSLASDTARVPFLDTGSWHFYTVSWGLDSVRFYINGAWVHSAITGDTAGYEGSELGFYLGARHGDENFFNGRLDDVWVWSTALTRAQIDTLYDMALTSIGENAVPDRIVTVYPNPSSGRVTIETGFAISRIFLFDALGREIYAGKQEEIGNTIVFQLSPGTYCLRILDDQNRAVQQKVVIH